jgi:hypothetical protein
VHSGELINPALATLLQSIIALGLESLEKLYVSSLHLTVAPWVSYRSVTDIDVDVVEVLLEHFALELCTLVSYNPIWDPKEAYNGLGELHIRCFIDGGHSGCLRPLGELVDGNIQEVVAANDLGERAENIHPPHTTKGQEGGTMCA